LYKVRGHYFHHAINRNEIENDTLSNHDIDLEESAFDILENDNERVYIINTLGEYCYIDYNESDYSCPFD